MRNEKAGESTLSTDYCKDTVPLSTKSGKRPFKEDFPVIDSSLYDKLKAVRREKGRTLNFVASLFNHENEKIRKNNKNFSFEEQTD